MTRNKIINKRSLVSVAAAVSVAAGCYSLDIAAVQPANGTAFTREEVLADPSLMELVVAGLFINFWGGATYAQPWTVYSAYGEEITSSALTVPNFNRGGNPSQIWEHVLEPRTEFDNYLTGTSFFARDPWSNFYEANAAATEMTRLIKANNIKVIDKATNVDNTARVLAFAKWLQGMSHVYLGVLFDSAAIITDQIDLSQIPEVPFKHHREVLDSAIKWLEEVIVLCNQNTFLLPLNDDLWVYNTAFTNEQMRAVAHSYIARALVYGARTPAERAAVDWNRVKTHVQAGAQAPFGPQGFPNPLISFDYRQAMTSAPINNNTYCNGRCTHGGEFRVDLRLLGPADTSGAYQTWLQKVSVAGFDTVTPFVVRTPDARIQPEGVAIPLNKPTYFKFTVDRPPTAIMDPLRGEYYWSNYWNSTRALDNREQLPRNGGGANRRNTSELGAIQDAMLLPVEMDLLQAEAEYRLGNFSAAAALINQTRTVNGALPAVTAAGVPVSPGCVPRRYDGSCGDLFDALMYEKRIETYGTAISFFDLRGWGCLLEGTPIELPPPGRQLDLLRKTVYSYGGVGKQGAAPKPASCPMLHRP